MKAIVVTDQAARTPRLLPENCIDGGELHDDPDASNH
jgi:hypothetical protein